MPAGRPTIYNEGILLKTKEYIDSCKDGYEVIERPAVKEGKHIGNEDHRIAKVRIPTIEGLAVFLDVNKTTVYAWRKEYEEFSNLIDLLLAKQADMLISNGLTGEYNTVIAKVLLTKHGYRDALDTDLTTKGDRLSISDEQYNQLIKAAGARIGNQEGSK